MLEVSDFGVNPGNLGMFKFVPSAAEDHVPLVVALHGGQQSAAEFDRCAGWSALAAAQHFALLLPAQRTSNNFQNCFNWFQPEDIFPDAGEVASIHSMVVRMLEDHRIDQKKIFVTGLSAGGAMACALLASYPRLFTAGAVIAGLPYRAANGAFDAFRAMSYAGNRSSREWGDLVSEAQFPMQPKAWPKISIWHGNKDATVAPGNAYALVSQWSDLHHLRIEDSSVDFVDGQSRFRWCDPKGRIAVELYAIEGLAHGIPVNSKRDGLGVSDYFAHDVGISSTYHIAKSWGLLAEQPIEAALDLPNWVLPPIEARRTSHDSGFSFF